MDKIRIFLSIESFVHVFLMAHLHVDEEILE